MAYATRMQSKANLAKLLKRIKDREVRNVVQMAYMAGHRDGYNEALEEVL